jgi:3-deoxy-D-manno-octulosonate 8-phosphate phosphatase (KDO 8-P phosphatase)
VRLKALGIEHARFGTEDKLPAAEEFLKTLGLGWHQSAAMGDDWPDLPLLQRAAFACAPQQAHAQALALADYVTNRQGGEGAAREFCDVLVVASGQYSQLLSRVGTPAAS